MNDFSPQSGGINSILLTGIRSTIDSAAQHLTPETRAVLLGPVLASFTTRGTGKTPVRAFFRNAGGLEIVNDFRTIAGKQCLEDFRVNLIGQKSHSSVSKHDIESLTCIVEQTVER